MEIIGVSNIKEAYSNKYKLNETTTFDKDLMSIQEVRELIKQAKSAKEKLRRMEQDKLDVFTKAIADAGNCNAERMAKAAVEETGFGRWQDKVIKNQFASNDVYNAIKHMKTVGILSEDKEKKIIDIGVPVGIIAGLVPSTNPTATVIYKSMISIKSGNPIIFAPHPNAKKSIILAVNIVKEALLKVGCPQGAVDTITIPSIEASNELMRHKDVALILATGGPGMVKAAYSSGNPAIGVGAGNGPAFIDKSANIKEAVAKIIRSKTFDNGTVCASEQSIVVEKNMEETVKNELKRQGAYFLDKEDTDKLGKFILRANGTMNPQIVGKSADVLAKMADLKDIPKNTTVLVGCADKVSKDVPYAHEKLTTILAFYVEENVEAVMHRCRELLEFEGIGHTFAIHSNNEKQIKEFACEMPASRILINTPAALGGVGKTTNLFPALTLGCGADGGSSTSNNVGPMDLINIKKAAYGVEKNESEILSQRCECQQGCCEHDRSDIDIDTIVAQVMEKLMCG